ncbi:MAG TPA: UbiH/UbiF family hydroxylase [Burkholderiales bacterium]|nr:UbiH/UbiF family hydroxylase [Burkholderiales bacterium]
MPDCQGGGLAPVDPQGRNTRKGAIREQVLGDNVVDLAIVGGGLVGLSVAAALRGSGLSVVLMDRAPPPALLPPQLPDWDVRVFAISPGSEAFLRGCGTWPDAIQRIQPVDAMQIYGDSRTGYLRFDARDARTVHLASIVENRLLLHGLWSVVRDDPDVRVCAPARAIDVDFETDSARLLLESGESVRARLLVAADGANSWLRAHAGIFASASSYRQSAIVANFECERPHGGTAFQWFRNDGVLALLPLPGRRCSMVWSADESLAVELMQLPSDLLAARVETASQRQLGSLTSIGPAAGFPLQLVRVPRLVQPRLALVGDAAHNLHPLAGQGVNLGFQDARDLVTVLRERRACPDVGQYQLLRRYERMRREDVLTMTLATDGLHRLFDIESRPLSWLRNSGLSVLNRVGPIKRLLVRHALG